MAYTSNNFWSWHQKWERGYFNTLHPTNHPETIQKKAAQESELRAALRADGVRDVEKLLAWAEQKARAWEQGATLGLNAHPMVKGFSLNMVFVLRLLRGDEQGNF